MGQLQIGQFQHGLAGIARGSQFFGTRGSEAGFFLGCLPAPAVVLPRMGLCLAGWHTLPEDAAGFPPELPAPGLGGRGDAFWDSLRSGTGMLSRIPQYSGGRSRIWGH